MDPVDVEQAQTDVDGYFSGETTREGFREAFGTTVDEVRISLESGTFPNLPLADYLRVPLWSQSSLKEAAKSALHAKAARDASVRTPPTDAMLLGSALHLAFLEPDKAEGRIVVWLGKARRGEAWADFQAKNKGKIILTNDQYGRLAGMIHALRDNFFVDKLARFGDMPVEVTKIGDVCGLKMKGRADALGEFTICDIKTVKSADPRKFLNACIQFGYDVQGAVYCELFDRDKFCLICVESDRPHDVVVFELSQAMLDNGRRKMMGYIKTILEAERTGIWPGRSSTPITLESPSWDTEVDTEPTVERCEPPEEIDP